MKNRDDIHHPDFRIFTTLVCNHCFLHALKANEILAELVKLITFQHFFNHLFHFHYPFFTLVSQRLCYYLAPNGAIFVGFIVQASVLYPTLFQGVHHFFKNTFHVFSFL